MANRRQRERQRRREAILEAATVVFAEHGVDGASMEAIAERCDLSKALLYYYFPDKRALHRATAVSLVERFFADLTATTPPTGALPDVVEGLLAFYQRHFTENRDLLRVMGPYLHHVGALFDDPEAMAAITLAHRPWMDRMGPLLARTPWASDPAGFQAFLFDITVILKDLCLAGRDAEAAARVRFYSDLVRRACRGAGETA